MPVPPSPLELPREQLDNVASGCSGMVLYFFLILGVQQSCKFMLGEAILCSSLCGFSRLPLNEICVQLSAIAVFEGRRYLP
jgi:hypothetical protein